jgi:thiamine-phosphate pyrophosphorylase
MTNDALNRTSKLTLPRVYPITDVRLAGLSHAEQVRRLIDGGATLIQLREKDRPPKQFYPDALEALAVARYRGVRLIVNDRVDIALAVGADGVHLGQDDLPPAEARKLLGDDKIIGFSTHSIEQARRALEEPIDYIAIGPVFGTSTKENPDPTVGPETVIRVRQIIGPDIPLVAIGGIDITNLRSVLDAGADSAAVIGALFAGPDPVEQSYRRLSQQ